MPLQDLTPELRTRLNRVEQTVGWFVILATLILLGGFGYYLYATAQSRGWFVTKINFATGVNDAAQFKLGDQVKLMGLNVGEITAIIPNAPDKARGLTIYFNIRDPYYGYAWYDSHIRVVSDFLGNRYLEVEKGKFGAPLVKKDKQTGELLVLDRLRAYHEYTNLLAQAATNAAEITNLDDATLFDVTNRLMHLLTNDAKTYYVDANRDGYTRSINPSLPPEKRNYCWIPPLDTPTLSDRFEAVAVTIEQALPNILNLTNQLGAVLSNANDAVVKLNSAIAKTDPILGNVATITGNLRDPNGSLGNWILPPPIASQLRETMTAATEALKSAHTTLDSTDTNITMLAVDLDKTLQHLADLTSNLDAQVQTNSNLIGEISTTIVHTDGLIQGLKRHWLLRSAFKEKKVKPAKKEDAPPAPSSDK